MISVDPLTHVISVPQSDLTPIGGVSYQLNTNVFRLSLRDWEDSEEGIYQLKTHNHNTTVLLGGIQYSRVLEILSPYTVTFEETGTPYVVNLTGSNNNILEKTNLGTVQILSNNSAGLINVAETQYGAFDDHVTVDTGNISGRATAGVAYPIGTESAPSDNLTDALAIAVSRGFDELNILGNLVVGATDDISNYVLVGQGATLNVTRTLVTLTSGCTTTNTVYNNCKVTGVQGGESHYHNCVIGELSDAHCHYKESALVGPITFTASVGSSHTTDMHDCYTGNDEITLDQNGSQLKFAIYNFSGQIKFTNGTHAGSITRIHMTGGTVTIDATCTAGTYIITGWCSVVNASTATVDTSGIIKNVVWNATIADHLTAGTTGKALSDAGGAGNPWGTPISGNTDAGTFGELVGKKLLTVAKFLGLK